MDDRFSMHIFSCQDKRFVPGAGATEIELAKQLASHGETIPGLAQYAIKQYAQAFEALPRALAENAGVKSTEVLSKLYAAHQGGNSKVGFDIEVRLLVFESCFFLGLIFIFNKFYCFHKKNPSVYFLCIRTLHLFLNDYGLVSFLFTSFNFISSDFRLKELTSKM